MENHDIHKVAVLTGATGAIGAAAAQALSAAGYALVLSAPSNERLCDLRSQLPGPCLVVAGNLRMESMPRALLETAMRHFGRCDVCLNNGGVLEAASIEAFDIERLCAMVRVNIESTFRMAYTFLQHFVRQGRGHLVNTTGTFGRRVPPTLGAYAAAKYALEALSEALQMELCKTDVRISCIEPGRVRTSRNGHWQEPPAALLGLRETCEPEAVARLVEYILREPEDAQAKVTTATSGDAEHALTMV